MPCRPEPGVTAVIMTQQSLENLERELLNLNEPSFNAYCGFDMSTVTVADAATQTDPEPEAEQQNIAKASVSASTDDFDRSSPATATFAGLDMTAFLGSLNDPLDNTIVLPEWCIDSGALAAEYDPLARVWDDWMTLETAL